MMASIGPGGFHPGMQAQHPGVHPGHPMGAPGMAHNPSQPGAQPGMPPQMAHMAVSGPGGQVNPAMMAGGMPPGAGGPNAHALQHLSPQMFQNQQQFASQNHQMNPQMMAQIQQQQLMQQQRQAILQQQMYGNAMPGMNMQRMNMGNMTAAQFQAMRNGNMQNMQRVGLPQHMQQAHLQQGQPQNPHAQQILAQQLAMQHQAQQQANNHMHQGNQPGNPGQMTPQQIHNLQQAQQAQLAQSMANQGVPQGPQGQASQPQPQPQGQPQQQGQQPQPQQQQPGQQQPGPQPGQQPQPNSQAPQRAPTPAVAQPSQPQNQGPNPAQGNQPQQPQGQGQPPNGQQSQPQQPNAQLLQAAQHPQLSTNIQQQLLHQQQHKNDGMKGHCLLKLLQFGEHLSGYPGSRTKDDLSYWNNFVAQFFSPRGVFRIALWYIGSDQANEDHSDKQYEITQPALARYFNAHFESGIRRINLTFERGITDRPLPNGCHFIENQKASLTYWFDNSHVVSTGTLRASFDSDQKLELLEFITQSHEEYHSRKMVIEAAKPAHNWVKDWLKVNGQDSRSPEMSKKGKAKPMKSPPNPPPDIDLPQSAVKQNIGITEAVFQFLEIIEVVGQMNPLFQFYNSQLGSLSPYGALEQYVTTVINNPNGQPMVNGQQANGPPNPRTPSFGQFPIGASPAATHLQLPNSPHMGSPAQGHMQAPGMQLQPSQQGTSSGGPSANTSPASNKRRRPSTVKAEEDSGAPTPASIGGPPVNGVTMANKKPPTPRMQKRLKGNPA
ncbi:LIM-domain binding protein-domain-containing protein [Hypoxylon fuscum]|nr:LIM-domain binding protein-domain-containing protein [Hypoxylon fuscum]